MNTKLLDMRIKSIKHYQAQIISLEGTITIIEKTQTELVNELVQFCDFEPGDIICRGSLICIFHSVKCSFFNPDKPSNNIGLVINVLKVGPYTNGQMTQEETYHFYLDKLDDWTILKKHKKDENG